MKKNKLMTALKIKPPVAKKKPAVKKKKPAGKKKEPTVADYIKGDA